MSKINSKKKKYFSRILVIEVIVVILLLASAKLYSSFRGTIEKIPRNYEDDEKIVLNEELEIDGYRNIVIFGLDSRDNSLKRGNSDTIMVASLNNKNKDIRLVSIYRDTYVNIPDIGYDKINAAYAKGGYAMAISTINLNFDLDIEEYVTVSFKALVETIDELGGITLDIKDEELKYLNGYVRELNRINDTDVKGLKSAGKQTVNGTQATAYARIRYTSGGDFKRTERQRIVISKVFDKIKGSKLTTIYDLIDTIFPQTLTNLSDDEIIDLAKGVLSYDIVDETGFPFEKEALKYKKVSYVFPINLEDNVIRLHQFLFEKETYEPSQKVKEYSKYIEGIRGQ